jgi:hypothetical protein
MTQAGYHTAQVSSWIQSKSFRWYCLFGLNAQQQLQRAKSLALHAPGEWQSQQQQHLAAVV